MKNKFEGYEVRNSMVVMEKIVVPVSMEGTNFQFSGQDSNDMPVQTAKILAQASDVPTNDVGKIAHYMKARAYDVALKSGKIVTLIDFRSIVMIMDDEESTQVAS